MFQSLAGARFAVLVCGFLVNIGAFLVTCIQSPTSAVAVICTAAERGVGRIVEARCAA
ncbi:hypothetical protein [Saccharothrix sp. ALI-22-I]|uniref:hypothetical protein n=1 Tax=Saccharothrix sp. ALI-22-I TaxID=1933778 RepID=UPI0015C324BE|nr:hypothetical protein [Saccharothrix sp. ALI-22-I]